MAMEPVRWGKVPVPEKEWGVDGVEYAATMPDLEDIAFVPVVGRKRRIERGCHVLR